mgnify:CR=1 FL=1
MFGRHAQEMGPWERTQAGGARLRALPVGSGDSGLRPRPAPGPAGLTCRGPVGVRDAGHGDSISVSGVCLTVVDRGEDWFTADVMAETIAMSTLSGITAGSRVNLERAAQVGDRLGGQSWKVRRWHPSQRDPHAG